MAGKIELNRGARTCLGESGIGYVYRFRLYFVEPSALFQ